MYHKGTPHPQLGRITLYPVKSLPGVDVECVSLTEAGALVHDREYALVDARGGFINGKQRVAVHGLRATCSIIHEAVYLVVDGQSYALNDAGQRQSAERELSDFFNEPVRIVHNAHGGYPDDTDSPGPTILASASLHTVAGWFADLSADDARQRFRANLEIDGCPAFWEDQLFGVEGAARAFRVGEAEFLGVNPCMRCVVPTRDPRTGVADTGFQRTFAAQRRATLPAWAERSRFDFYYRLSVNTRARVDQAGKVIRVGDAIELIQP